MAVPTFVGAGAIVGDASGPASTTPTPPTHVADDILIAAAYNQGVAMTTATGGWTSIASVGGGLHDAEWWWARAAGAGTAGPTITATATDQWAICYAIRGCITTGTPFEDATTAGDASTSETTPDSAEVTTTGDDRLVVSIVNIMTDPGWSSGWPPSGWTADDSQTDITGVDSQFSFMSRAEASATTVSAAVFGTLAFAAPWASLTLAFIPAPPAVIPDIFLTGATRAAQSEPMRR